MEVLVAVVLFLPRTAARVHIHEPIALALRCIDAHRGVVAQCRVEGACDAERTVVADREFTLDAGFIARTTRDHVDYAGGGVLAEDRALRALEHFDALEFAQVAEADAVARPVHAI